MTTAYIEPSATSPPQPFDGVRYSIIQDQFTPDEQERLQYALTNNGATHVPLQVETGRLQDLSKITFVLAKHHDFPEYEACWDNRDNLHVVKPSWVEDSLSKHRAALPKDGASLSNYRPLNPRTYSPHPNMIFSEVVMTAADIPEGDCEAIRGGLDAMGGTWSSRPTRLLTHLVALQMDNEVVDFVRQKKLKCKIVLPHWFDDCMKLRKRISEAPYELPDPLVLKNETAIKDSYDIPNPEAVLGATESHPQPDKSVEKIASRNRLSVFKDQRIMFSADLNLSVHLLETLKGIVTNGKGKVVDSVSRATTLVCRFRETDDFATAYAGDKEIGNLAWFYYLVTTDRWTSPMKRLMHYPTPKSGVPDFEKTLISISTYTGEARVYIENLITALGGVFTKTLKDTNTHLVTAHKDSEKCKAALDWNVNVVNHLWLEESYAAVAMQPLSKERYTMFPNRTHLGEVVGQTPIDRAVLDQQFRPRSQSPRTKKVIDESDDAHEATSTRGAAKRHALKSGKESARTPMVSRVAAGKENETPSTTGSRVAKVRAAAYLKDAALDIVEYEKEKKRVGGVTHGHARSSDSNSFQAASKKRMTPDVEDKDDEQQQEETGAGRQSKKLKTAGSSLPPISQRLMVTKYEKWDKPDQKSKDRNQLRNLGIHVVDTSTDCTILCAPGILRTLKFVAAIAAAPLIVNTDWLDTVLRTNKVPPADRYLLEDRGKEDTLGFKLSVALERARSNNRKLFKGWQIFCTAGATQGVTGGLATYKAIVEANGGICTLYDGRSFMTASKRSFSRDTQENAAIADNQGDDEGNTWYMISGDTTKDRELWSKFRDLAAKEAMVPKIVKSDWLINVAMSQRVVSAGIWEFAQGEEDVKLPSTSKKTARRR